MSPTARGSDRHWFEAMADHMGSAYLRYSFTKGTQQEVEFLIGELALGPGARLLDIGCGPGRHALELARRGMCAVGVDISSTFIALAQAEADAGRAGGRGETGGSAVFHVGDARNLTYSEEFDAVISLCQGGFGLCGPQPGTEAVDPQLIKPDLEVLGGIRRSLKLGGRFALSAFSAYFQMRWIEESDQFDAASGINHETTEVLDSDRRPLAADLWTTCFTPRELRLLVERSGLEVDAIYSVTPGEYRRAVPSIDSQEFLVIGHRSC